MDLVKKNGVGGMDPQNFVARQKNGVGQNFGVGGLGPLNFGMGRKHGVGQKEFSSRCIVNIPLYLFMVFLYF